MNSGPAADARKSYITTLQEFYSIVIGLALTSGVQKFVSVIAEGVVFDEIISLSLISVAFLATVVPFYHGMNRHLYDAHIEEAQHKSGRKPIPLLVDIFSFIFMSGILFAMGRVIDDPLAFFWLWIALLSVDVIWSCVVYLVQGGVQPNWALNNIVWGLIAMAIYFGLPWLLRWFGGVLSVGISDLVYLIVVAEILRSIFDYKINWAFYFK